jgi:hypothetical protein
VSESGDHVLSGSFPTEVLKEFTLNEDGEVEEEITAESHRPEHLAGDSVECSCGKRWEGLNAQQDAVQHLRRASAIDEVEPGDLKNIDEYTQELRSVGYQAEYETLWSSSSSGFLSILSVEGTEHAVFLGDSLGHMVKEVRNPLHEVTD